MNSSHLIVGGTVNTSAFETLLDELTEGDYDFKLQKGLFVVSPAPSLQDPLIERLVDLGLPFIRNNRTKEGYEPTHVFQPQYDDQPRSIREDEIELDDEAIDSLGDRLKVRLKDTVQQKLPESDDGIWQTIRSQIENIDGVLQEVLKGTDFEQDLPPLTINGQPVTEQLLEQYHQSNRRSKTKTEH